MGRARDDRQPTGTSCCWSWPGRTVPYMQLRLTRCSPTPVVNCGQAFQSLQTGMLLQCGCSIGTGIALRMGVKDMGTFWD